jgi:hypothetical protein
MEAARTSETSVDNYFTRQCIPEDNSELHTRRRENLESHNIYLILESMRFLFCFGLITQRDFRGPRVAYSYCLNKNRAL